MCLAQGHKAVMLVRLKPAAPRSRVKHSTTEPSALTTALYFSFHLMAVVCVMADLLLN